MKTRLVVVRHGESRCNLEGRLQGQYDSPLTPLGLRQAEACAEYLKDMAFDAAYSSDLSRAYITAKTIAAKHDGLTVTQIPEIREIYFGKWQYMKPAEIAEKYPEDYAEWKTSRWDVHPTGGECMGDVAARACPAVWDIARRHEGGTVLVVTHNGPMRMLQCDWLGIPYERMNEAAHTKNVGVYIMDYDTESGKITPVVMGETGFLANIGAAEASDRY